MSTIDVTDLSFSDPQEIGIDPTKQLPDWYLIKIYNWLAHEENVQEALEDIPPSVAESFSKQNEEFLRGTANMAQIINEVSGSIQRHMLREMSPTEELSKQSAFIFSLYSCALDTIMAVAWLALKELHSRGLLKEQSKGVA